MTDSNPGNLRLLAGSLEEKVILDFEAQVEELEQKIELLELTLKVARLERELEDMKKDAPALQA